LNLVDYTSDYTFLYGPKSVNPLRVAGFRRFSCSKSGKLTRMLGTAKYRLEQTMNIYLRGKTYWIQYTDFDGKRCQQSLKTRERRAAEIKAGDILRRIEFKKVGIINPFEEQQFRPIEDHLDEFLAHLEARGVSFNHYKNQKRYVESFLEHSRMRTLAEFTDSAAAVRWLTGGTQAGLSNRTFNKRRQAIRQFTRWLVRNRRLPFDPFEGLPIRDEATDRRRVRRALTPDELQRLMTAARHHARSTKEGEVRAWCYYFTACTGLRKSTLKALTWSDIDWDHGLLVIPVTKLKGKKSLTIPLRDDVFGELKRRYSDQAPDQRIFPRVPMTYTLYEDLDNAKIPRIDAAGKVVDFHALRMTFISELAATGASPTDAQKLAGHSDVNLTMRVYTDPRVLDLRADVERLRFTFNKPEGKKTKQAS